MLWWTLRQLKSKDTETRKYAAKKLGESKNIKAVEPLIFALKDPNGDVRGEVVEALAKIGDVRAVEPLIVALKDSSDNVLENVAEALGKIGDKRAVKPLIAMLGRSKNVREKATEALVKLGKVAVKPLIIALKDFNSNVRIQAAVALGKIGDERAIEPLIVALKDSIVALKDSNEYVRIRAAEMLGEIGDERAVKPLIVALNDSDSVVRITAAVALGKIGDERAIEPLIIALKDSDSVVRRCVAKALDVLKFEPTDETQQAMMFVAHQKWDNAVKLGEVAVEPLIMTLEYSGTNSSLCMRAAEALGKIGDLRAVDPLIVALNRSIDKYPRVRLGLSEKEPQRPYDVIAMALGRFGDKRAINQLVVLYKYSPKLAIMSLRLMGAIAISPLFQLLVTEESHTAWIDGSFESYVYELREPMIKELASRNRELQDTITSILAGRDASNVPETDLIKIANKNTIKIQYTIACTGMGGNDYDKENDYFFRARQFARQELIRRGIET